MNPKEYNECVKAYSDAVFRFIVSNLKDYETARDIVQSAYEVLWRKIDQVDLQKAKSFLFTVAYRDMIDHIRKNKRFEPITEVNDHLGMVSNTYTGASESLQACLSTLPEIQQHVLMLRDYEGYDYKEIGVITGLNESQVKVYIFRARTALKSLIGKKEVIL